MLVYAFDDKPIKPMVQSMSQHSVTMLPHCSAGVYM